MQTGAVSSRSTRPIVRFANLISTNIVGPGNPPSKGVSAVAKTLVRSSANIMSTFSLAMLLVTGGNLLSKWNNFINEDWVGKTKQLFVPVVSAVAALLPHVIIGLFADGVKPTAVVSSAFKLTDDIKQQIIPSYFKSLSTIGGAPSVDKIRDSLLAALEVTTHDCQVEEDVCRKKFLLAPFRDSENGIKYLQTLHREVNDNLCVIKDNNEDVVYGFRFTAKKASDLKDSAGYRIDITYLAKKEHEDDSMFVPVGNEVKLLSEILTVELLTKLVDDRRKVNSLRKSISYINTESLPVAADADVAKIYSIDTPVSVR